MGQAPFKYNNAIQLPYYLYCDYLMTTSLLLDERQLAQPNYSSVCRKQWRSTVFMPHKHAIMEFSLAVR